MRPHRFLGHKHANAILILYARWRNSEKARIRAPFIHARNISSWGTNRLFILLLTFVTARGSEGNLRMRKGRWVRHHLVAASNTDFNINVRAQTSTHRQQMVIRIHTRAMIWNNIQSLKRDSFRNRDVLVKTATSSPPLPLLLPLLLRRKVKTKSRNRERTRAMARRTQTTRKEPFRCLFGKAGKALILSFSMRSMATSFVYCRRRRHETWAQTRTALSLSIRYTWVGKNELSFDK